MAARRKLTNADHVWNRACYREGRNLRDGDRALADVLLINGYITNGGVNHAYDLQKDEFDAGLRGLEFFGLHDLVEIIKEHEVLRDEAVCNARYYERADDMILENFQRKYAQSPELFAPVEDE